MRICARTAFRFALLLILGSTSFANTIPITGTFWGYVSPYAGSWGEEVTLVGDGFFLRSYSRALGDPFSFLFSDSNCQNVVYCDWSGAVGSSALSLTWHNVLFQDVPDPRWGIFSVDFISGGPDGYGLSAINPFGQFTMDGYSFDFWASGSGVGVIVSQNECAALSKEQYCLSSIEIAGRLSGYASGPDIPFATPEPSTLLSLATGLGTILVLRFRVFK